MNKPTVKSNLYDSKKYKAYSIQGKLIEYILKSSVPKSKKSITLTLNIEFIALVKDYFFIANQITLIPPNAKDPRTLLPCGIQKKSSAITDKHISCDFKLIESSKRINNLLTKKNPLILINFKIQSIRKIVKPSGKALKKLPNYIGEQFSLLFDNSDYKFYNQIVDIIYDFYQFLKKSHLYEYGKAIDNEIVARRAFYVLAERHIKSISNCANLWYANQDTGLKNDFFVEINDLRFKIAALNQEDPILDLVISFFNSFKKHLIKGKIILECPNCGELFPYKVGKKYCSNAYTPGKRTNCQHSYNNKLSYRRDKLKNQK